MIIVIGIHIIIIYMLKMSITLENKYNIYSKLSELMEGVVNECECEWRESSGKLSKRKAGCITRTGIDNSKANGLEIMLNNIIVCFRSSVLIDTMILGYWDSSKFT